MITVSIFQKKKPKLDMVKGHSRCACRALRGGGLGELLFNGYGVPIWEDEKVLGIDGMTVAHQRECT